MANLNLVPKNLMVAPATLSSASVALVWEKPAEQRDVTGYQVNVSNHKILIRAAAQTHVTVTGLKPATNYEFKVTTILKNHDLADAAAELTVTTKPGSKVINLADTYQVDIAGEKIETANLQRAINDLPENGTLLIPEGVTILTGAIDLKSNMTLQVDGILKGSLNPADYTYSPAQQRQFAGKANLDGLILTRYEGWEMYCYRSLINAGYLNPDDRSVTNCENVTICGQGVIYGGGNKLGTAMKKLYADKKKYLKYVSDNIGGRRVRGRLLSFIQCKNVHLTGITVQNPPCWTIHLIYCDYVTTHGIHVKSQGVDNGDGWDPDSSRHCMIFDTTFETGDDCIAIKSGKNPEGNQINLPCADIRIFDLEMMGGHGLAIGSEESGGVQNVSIRDCRIQNTDYGIELKASASRGGYINGFSAQDCIIDRFLVHGVQYNLDGSSAKSVPEFKNIKLINVRITGSSKDYDVAGHLINNRQQAIELVGFDSPDDPTDDTGFISDVSLNDVKLKSDNVLIIDKARNVALTHVTTMDGNPLSLKIGNSIKKIVIN
ncbi:glycosyl hydrolase family 28 protein [Lentilactobacillus raoultii]|uniref:Glycosyl hydrolase family 28 protein n=1 Tax=Lentilactobacillus raoultii TaxID=1987503 RepID=A0ABW3PSR3_9LACO|nr:glycoside hydrolase family 28 protein [Lentilactobacillus raoultii]